MKFDKETLIALIICVAVLLVWPFAARFFSSKEQKAVEAVKVEETVKKEQPSEAKAAVTPAPKVKLPTVQLANADLKLEISPLLASILKVTYLNHKTAKGDAEVATV